MQTKKTILVLLLIIVLCIFCYYFVDQQLVWWLYAHHSRDVFGLKIMANKIINVIGVFIFLYYIYFAIRLWKFDLKEIDTRLIVMCNSIVTAYFVKEVSKLIFGRYWTATFICNNLSLINNHVYGFNWFTKGSASTSFPSGHASFIFAFATSMWLLFPRFRWLWVLLATMVVIGQIAMYYHFVSDIIAGATLGTIVALCNYRYWALRNRTTN